MAERMELIYKSEDGKTQIHATEWYPEERSPKAILQIVHGMQEYIGRYNGFASYMADRGFIVVGEDHLGHGNTAENPGDYGYFGEDEPELALVREVHQLKKTIQAENPGLPYFMYGFSMGSFITRKYMTMYGEGLDGVIIGGTGWVPEGKLNMDIFITSLLSKLRGGRYRSKFVQNRAFKGYNKRVAVKRTGSDWICSDKRVVDAYVEDDKCNYIFTVNGFNTITKLIKYVQEPKNAQRIPENLPVHFVAGEEDPVGDYGEGVKKAAEFYLVNGMKNVSIKLYDNMRHEIHNEKKKHVVYLDYLEWLESLL
ncbi:MAG: serine aminopeptidase domain-containing protein [Lachnospiraceae bacterium]